MPTLRVVDSTGAPRGGIAVMFAITSGDGILTNWGISRETPTITTNSDGLASPGPWLLGPTPGRQTLTATIAGLPPVEFFVSATGTPVPFAAKTITAGDYHTCALADDGNTYCWGSNSRGQLGDGTTAERYLPVAVAGGLRFAALSAGGVHTCGLTSDGAAYCWGSNTYGELGDGTTTPRAVPTPVAEGRRFAAISSASGHHTCALEAGGAAYCWGHNDYGQLGDGTRIDRTVPTRVADGHTFATISSRGSTTCGLTPAGAGLCWGFRWSSPTSPDYEVDLVPTPAGPGHTFTSLVGACGLEPAGTVSCLGGEPRIPGRSIVSPFGGGQVFQSFDVGTVNCGITPAGVALCWGSDYYGQLGDGSGVSIRAEPAPVPGWQHFSAVTVGLLHVCGISDGIVVCWGDNTYGQLGRGLRSSKALPQPVILRVDP